MSSNKPKIGESSYSQPSIKSPFEPVESDGLNTAIRAYIDQRILEHQHNGVEASRTDIDSIQGLFETVSSVPTGIPSDIYDQIKIYKNGSTYRLYCFEGSTNTWRYASLT